MLRRSYIILPGALALLAAALVATGCGSGGGGGIADDAWAYGDGDVTGSGADDNAAAQSIQVDVYVDATTSMTGYLTGGGSAYTQFLEKLESAVRSGWAQSGLDYFKFGSRVKPVERAAFRTADEVAFYRERGIFRTTRIDSVLARMDRSGVSVVVTDLFQNESDMNTLVSQIKNDVFRRGLDAAVLGVRSQFDGRIYDAKVPAYDYASTPGDPSTYRPFYALMFGEASKLRRLFETLRSSSFIEREHFALISPYLVRGYDVRLRKTRDSRDLNLSGTDEEARRFAFNLRSGGSGGTLDATIALERAPSAPRFSAERIEMSAYRKKLSRRPGEGDTDSSHTQDLTLQSLRRAAGDTLRARLRLYLEDEPAGIYSYQTVFHPGAIGGLSAPAWIENFSSANPSPANAPNATLNLSTFVTNLIQASSSVRRPKLAKAYITVRKL